MDYKKLIEKLPVIGSLQWKFAGKTHVVDVTEVVYDFGDEKFIRYKGPLHLCNPLVRVKNNLVYFLTERSSSGEIDWPEFDTRGCKGNLELF